MSFSNLKKNSKSNIGRLTEEITKLNKGSESYKDDRFWKPELDKSSNGYAVIRFLPASDGEDLPWGRVFNHGFKGKGGWFIENCPTTIGGKCPVCEEYSIFVSLHKTLFRCTTCGADIEQKINGKISYMPDVSHNTDIKMTNERKK